jgi:hypothetical protein
MKLTQRIRRHLSKINFPLFFHFSLFYREIARSLQSIYLIKDKHKYLSLNQLKQYKRSDTVFIF